MSQMTSASAPAPPSVSDVVREFCVAAREGRVPDGAQVRQRDLMSLCGASRARAQSAIAILRHRGLLLPDFHGQLRLRLPRRAEVADIYALRIALESLILEVSMERLSSADLDRIQGFFNRLRTAIRERHWDIDRVETIAFNGLARTVRWPMLVRMVSDLNHDLAGCQLLLGDLLATSNGVGEGEHLDDLWRAVRSGDAPTVQHLLRTHLERRAAWVLEHLPDTPAADPAPSPATY